MIRGQTVTQISENNKQIMTTQTLKEIRQSLGYDENDDSHDDEIYNMTVGEKMRAITMWHFGSSDWWSIFKTWLEECGHKIEEE